MQLWHVCIFRYVIARLLCSAHHLSRSPSFPLETNQYLSLHIAQSLRNFNNAKGNFLLLTSNGIDYIMSDLIEIILLTASCMLSFLVPQTKSNRQMSASVSKQRRWSLRRFESTDTLQYSKSMFKLSSINPFMNTCNVPNIQLSSSLPLVQCDITAFRGTSENYCLMLICKLPMPSPSAKFRCSAYQSVKCTSVHHYIFPCSISAVKIISKYYR